MRIEGNKPPVTIVLETEVDVIQVLDLLEENRIGPSDHPIVAHLHKVLPEPDGQETLFDAPEAKIEQAFPTNLVEWAYGQEAGWRGDVLVGEKSPDYMLGYNQGLASREAYKVWVAKNTKNEAAGQ